MKEEELRTYFVSFKTKEFRSLVEFSAKKHILDDSKNILSLYDEKGENIALINFDTVEYMSFIEKQCK